MWNAIKDFFTKDGTNDWIPALTLIAGSAGLSGALTWLLFRIFIRPKKVPGQGIEPR